MWLLEASVCGRIEQALRSGVVPTAQQQIEYEAGYSSSASETNSQILAVSGNTAELAVKGIITKTPSLLAMLFGGGNTTYANIVSALAEAESNDTIDNITLFIDSPGGHFDGLFDALAAIKSTKKPIKAVISNVGASAAFALASQADEIVASNIAARIGSVGVVATFETSDREISITSSAAPKKRPDVTTKEGKAIVQKELDAMHGIFAEAIAEGRSTTVKKVNDQFGQGAILLAREALNCGMIDAIVQPALKAVESAKTTTADSGGNQPEAVYMDLNQLQTQHPKVFAAAIQKGIDQERDRVIAHLTMGEASGDNKTATAAIKDGSELTNSLQAKYMAASMCNRKIQDRQDDDAGANAGDGARASIEQDDDAGVVAGLVESRLGINGEDHA